MALKGPVDSSQRFGEGVKRSRVAERVKRRLQDKIWTLSLVFVFLGTRRNFSCFIELNPRRVEVDRDLWKS